MENQEQWDNLMMRMAQELRGIDNLMEQFFGFLYRKTDYYKNADKQTQKTMIDRAFEKYSKLSEAEKQKQAAKKKEEKKVEKVEQKSQVVEVTEEEANAIEREEAEKKNKKQEAVNTPDDSESEKKKPRVEIAKVDPENFDILSPADSKDDDDDTNADENQLTVFEMVSIFSDKNMYCFKNI